MTEDDPGEGKNLGNNPFGRREFLGVKNGGGVGGKNSEGGVHRRKRVIGWKHEDYGADDV